MARPKRCRACNEILYCRACGARQTPETPDKKKFTMLLTDEQMAEVEREAKARGMTKAAYIRDVLGLEIAE
jgi:predicted DNA binding CopG/RHH family protein